MFTGATEGLLRCHHHSTVYVQQGCWVRNPDMLTWRSMMAVRLMMGRRNHSLSRRLPMGETHWLKMPNTLKPSLDCPMPIAEG